MCDEQELRLGRGVYVLVAKTFGRKPLEGVFEVSVVEVDVRSVNDPRKVAAEDGTSDWWYRKGTNHRVENGYIVRDLGLVKMWAIEISDMQEFVRKHEYAAIWFDRGYFYLLLEEEG